MNEIILFGHHVAGVRSHSWSQATLQTHLERSLSHLNLNKIWESQSCLEQKIDCLGLVLVSEVNVFFYMP